MAIANSFINAAFLVSLLLAIVMPGYRLDVNAQGSELTNVPPKSTMTYWADLLRVKLDQAALSYIPWPSVTSKCYQPALESSNVRFEQTNIGVNVKKAAEKISKMLKKKIACLQKSVKFAEKEARAYSWKDNLLINDTDYVDSKLLKKDDKRLEWSPHFRSYILKNDTSVHIPVEIYKGNIDILNGLNWTANLAKVFERNQKDDPTLLWQYFGSQAGFVRRYPGKKWVCHGPVDLYDVRRRAWYTQGSSSPKDMLILIDTSGSVHGQALQLIKVSVKSLLDTLGDDDFVNIVHFSSKAEHVGCFKTFVQANDRNKKVFMDAVDFLKAKGMADFKKGLTFAFKEFENFRVNSTNNQGAKCNEVIMLLTDGGSDTVEEVFKKYNPDKRVRVFSYAIGPTATILPRAPVRRIACNNSGYFSQIPAMGAIRSKVQEYLLALKAVQESNNGQNIHWTGIRLSSGLGMMTTVTLPVYNRTGNMGNQTILGVMGTDVSVHQMMEKLTDLDPGPISYAFAINSNGYIIFHPNQKTRHDWLDDTPNVDLLDVEHESEELVKLRKRMIDESSGEERIDNLILSPSYRSLTYATRFYYFAKIIGSDFTLGVVQPSYEKSRPVFNDEVSVSDLRKLFKTKSALVIPDWPYYEGYNRNSDAAGTLAGLLDGTNETTKWNKRLLAQLHLDLQCSIKMLDMALLYESRSNDSDDTVTSDNSTAPTPGFANQTTDSADYFTNDNDTDFNETLGNITDGYTDDNNVSYGRQMVNVTNDDGILSAGNATDGNLTDLELFPYDYEDSSTTRNSITTTTMVVNLTTSVEGIGTVQTTPSPKPWPTHGANQRTSFLTGASGLTRIHPESAGEALRGVEPRQSDYFQRTMDSDGYVYSATGLKGKKSTVNDTRITISRAIVVTVDNKKYKPAVIGTTESSIRVTEALMTLPEMKRPFRDLTCSDSDRLACYLVDDSAYVIASNNIDADTSDVGRFLGDVDCSLMRALENTVYNKTVFYDYQGTCAKHDTHTSSSRRLLPHLPSMSALFEMLTVNFWSSHLSWAFANFNFFSWLTSSSADALEDGYEVTEDGTCPSIQTKRDRHSCTVRRTIYSWLPGRLNDSGVANASACLRAYRTERIHQTNLLLIVAEPESKPGCEDKCDQTYQPLNKDDFSDNATFCSMQPRYRRRPLHCYSNTSSEISTECGTVIYHASTPLIILTFLLILFSVHSLTLSSP